MHISLFGGAFDPPHMGHYNVTSWMIESGTADEVWYVPVKNHPFGKQMSEAIHRVKMTEMMLIKRTRLESYELEQPGINYTFKTLEALSGRHPEHSFSFIIGSDNLPKFHSWLEHHPQLLDKYPFFVYPRQGYPFEPLYENMFPLKESPMVSVSSTEIREKLSHEESIEGLVLPEIAGYIEQNRLYR